MANTMRATQLAVFMFKVPDICSKPVGLAIWTLKQCQLLPGLGLELYNAASFQCVWCFAYS